MTELLRGAALHSHVGRANLPLQLSLYVDLPSAQVAYRRLFFEDSFRPLGAATGFSLGAAAIRMSKITRRIHKRLHLNWEAYAARRESLRSTLTQTCP